MHHDSGGDFKHSRHKKRDTLEQVLGKMFGKKKRGLDYTPLFKFLLSKVGDNWDQVFSEIKSRLDKTEPIFWMVSLNEPNKFDYFCIDESTFFSGLFVNEKGTLTVSNPELKATDLKHFCNCCTHTFNGVPF